MGYLVIEMTDKDQFKVTQVDSSRSVRGMPCYFDSFEEIVCFYGKLFIAFKEVDEDTRSLDGL